MISGYTFRKTLLLRQLITGAQFCYAHDMLWIALVGLLTDHTAIARIREENGELSILFLFLLLFAALLLMIDSIIYLIDLFLHKKISVSNKLSMLIGEYRPHMLLFGAVWHICLMSTVSVEIGIGPLIAYSTFFVGGAIIGIVIAVKDSCVSRDINNNNKKNN